MSATKTAQDVKKEEFRKYLDKGGVIELLTKALVALYEEPEKPNDAVQFLRSNMGAGILEKQQLEELEKENKELKEKISELESNNAQLQEKINSGGVTGEAPTLESEAPVKDLEESEKVEAAPMETEAESDKPVDPSEEKNDDKDEKMDEVEKDTSAEVAAEDNKEQEVVE